MAELLELQFSLSYVLNHSWKDRSPLCARQPQFLMLLRNDEDVSDVHQLEAVVEHMPGVHHPVLGI